MAAVAAKQVVTPPQVYADKLASTASVLEGKLDDAIARAVALRQRGASEEVVLTETLVAVQAAKALEGMTGVCWEDLLEQKACGNGEPGYSA